MGDVNDIPDTELIRRAIASCKAAKRGGTPLWSKVMGMFQLGSTYAQQLCVRHGFDPDKMVRK